MGAVKYGRNAICGAACTRSRSYGDTASRPWTGGSDSTYLHDNVVLLVDGSTPRRYMHCDQADS